MNEYIEWMNKWITSSLNEYSSAICSFFLLNSSFLRSNALPSSAARIKSLSFPANILKNIFTFYIFHFCLLDSDSGLTYSKTLLVTSCRCRLQLTEHTDRKLMSLLVLNPQNLVKRLYEIKLILLTMSPKLKTELCK